jgi:hypothetical protein
MRAASMSLPLVRNAGMPFRARASFVCRTISSATDAPPDVVPPDAPPDGDGSWIGTAVHDAAKAQEKTEADRRISLGFFARRVPRTSNLQTLKPSNLQTFFTADP